MGQAASKSARTGVSKAVVKEGGEAVAQSAGKEAVEAGAKKSFLESGPGVALIGAGGLAAVWAIPQLLGDSCNRAGEQAGLPPNSCVWIVLGGFILSCMMCCCVLLMVCMGSMSN